MKFPWAMNCAKTLHMADWARWREDFTEYLKYGKFQQISFLCPRSRIWGNKMDLNIKIIYFKMIPRMLNSMVYKKDKAVPELN